MSIYRGKNKNEIYLSSLLYDAIEDSDLRSVKLLLAEKHADPNLILPKTKISPFHLIIGNDSAKFALDVTTLILQHGGNPNIQSDDGLTPVHIAAAWGRYDILKLLLDCGGSAEVRDINKKTPLHYAFEESFQDCYNLLKLYQIDKAAILFKEKEDCVRYIITLDKILVNNATTVGEYEIVNEYKTDSISTKDLQKQKLQNLPQSDSKEYVMNWFNNQLQNTPKQIIQSEISDQSADSFKESDEERSSYLNVDKICFRKVYRKKGKTPKLKSSPVNTTHDTTSKEFSKESGITAFDQSSPAFSDYMTCTSSIYPDVHERNIFDLNSLITSDESNRSIKSQVSVATKSEGISSSDLSFVSVSEVYKYVDEEQGIVLYERRFLKTPLSDVNGSVKSFVSSKHSLPESFDYDDIDSDTIRRELSSLGYNAGPITITTKRVYLKKLKELRKHPFVNNSASVTPTRVYSNELEKTLKNPEWLKDLAFYRSLDEAVSRQFHTTDASIKWREGTNKTSFTYLLLDPRVTNNLPMRAEQLKPKEIWETFLSSIFYVGKGKRSRPYDHLYDAVNLWNEGLRTSSKCKKLERILNIWSDESGVICLHLFQNAIPVEAYTREAAIMNALKIENLCNVKSGNFYGVAATWTQKEKAMFGVFLLYKAMVIFLHEGERQLCPSDIN